MMVRVSIGLVFSTVRCTYYFRVVFILSAQATKIVTHYSTAIILFIFITDRFVAITKETSMVSAITNYTVIAVGMKVVIGVFNMDTAVTVYIDSTISIRQHDPNVVYGVVGFVRYVVVRPTILRILIMDL